MVAWSCPAHLRWFRWFGVPCMDDALGNGCHRAQGLGDSVVLVVHNTYFYPIRMAVRVFVSVLSALAPGGENRSLS